MTPAEHTGLNGYDEWGNLPPFPFPYATPRSSRPMLCGFVCGFVLGAIVWIVR